MTDLGRLLLRLNLITIISNIVGLAIRLAYTGTFNGGDLFPLAVFVAMRPLIRHYYGAPTTRDDEYARTHPINTIHRDPR